MFTGDAFIGEHGDAVCHRKGLRSYMGRWTRQLVRNETPEEPDPTPRPWLLPNTHGEPPHGLCCQRATGDFCYEHSRAHYKRKDGRWVLKQHVSMDHSQDLSGLEKTPQNAMEEAFCREYPDAIKTFGRVQAGSMLAVFRVAWQTQSELLQDAVEARTGAHEECDRVASTTTGLRDRLTAVKADNIQLRMRLEECRKVLTKAQHVLQASQDIDLIKAMEALIRF